MFLQIAGAKKSGSDGEEGSEGEDAEPETESESDLEPEPEPEPDEGAETMVGFVKEVNLRLSAPP